MLGPQRVTEVMNLSVATLTPAASAMDAARTLHERDIGSVVVVDDGDVVGIITESDVVTLVVDDRDPETLSVTELMSAPVHTIDAESSVVAAAELLRRHRIKKLPVCDGGELVGVLTTTDLSHYVPHVRRPERERVEGDGRVRQTSRDDTAYEDEDWEFEYVGHEGHVDVGDVVTFSKSLDDEEVAAFADASGDTNRLHLDDEYAAGTRFGRRVVHGTLVAGVVSAALARLPGLVIYLSQEVSYLGPVDIGERVTAECEVVEDIGRDRYRLATTVRDSDGETVVDGEAVVMADPIPDSA